MLGILPLVDPCQHGWEEDSDTKSLTPIMLPSRMGVAPEEVLRSTKCTCAASYCRTNMCSCSKSRIPCTAFCGCAIDGCHNEFNMVIGLESEDVEDAEDADGEDEDHDYDNMDIDD